MTPEQMEAAELAGTLTRLDEWRREQGVLWRSALLVYDGGWRCQLHESRSPNGHPVRSIYAAPHVLLHLAIESALARWREPEGGK